MEVVLERTPGHTVDVDSHVEYISWHGAPTAEGHPAPEQEPAAAVPVQGAGSAPFAKSCGDACPLHTALGGSLGSTACASLVTLHTLEETWQEEAFCFFREEHSEGGD